MNGPLKGNELGWPWVVQWPIEGNMPFPRYAPERLWQPINPGWTFGNVVVNNINSKAPEVEQTIASKVSYGREIGLISDALMAVLEVAMPKSAQGKRSVEKFKEVAELINDIKKQHQDSRIERLKVALNDLKDADQTAWKQLLEQALKEA